MLRIQGPAVTINARLQSLCTSPQTVFIYFVQFSYNPHNQNGDRNSNVLDMRPRTLLRGYRGFGIACFIQNQGLNFKCVCVFVCVCVCVCVCVYTTTSNCVILTAHYFTNAHKTHCNMASCRYYISIFSSKISTVVSLQ